MVFSPILLLTSSLFLFLIKLYCQLAWEPSVAQGTHSYSRHFPALFFYRETSFRYKIRPTQLRNSKKIKLRKFPWAFRVPELRQLGLGVPEL